MSTSDIPVFPSLDQFDDNALFSQLFGNASFRLFVRKHVREIKLKFKIGVIPNNNLSTNDIEEFIHLIISEVKVLNFEKNIIAEDIYKTLDFISIKTPKRT